MPEPRIPTASPGLGSVSPIEQFFQQERQHRLDEEQERLRKLEIEREQLAAYRAYQTADVGEEARHLLNLSLIHI